MIFFYRKHYFILTVNYFPIHRCDVLRVGRRAFFAIFYFIFIIIENDVQTRVLIIFGVQLKHIDAFSF